MKVNKQISYGDQLDLFMYWTCFITEDYSASKQGAVKENKVLFACKQAENTMLYLQSDLY